MKNKETLSQAAIRLSGFQLCTDCPFFNGKICCGGDKAMRLCSLWWRKGFMSGAKYYRDNKTKQS